MSDGEPDGEVTRIPGHAMVLFYSVAIPGILCLILPLIKDGLESIEAVMPPLGAAAIAVAVIRLERDARITPLRREVDRLRSEVSRLRKATDESESPRDR